MLATSKEISPVGNGIISNILERLLCWGFRAAAEQPEKGLRDLKGRYGHESEEPYI